MGTLNDVVVKYVKTLGEAAILKGTECMVDYPRLPTGVYSVDYAIGGGIPIGVTSSLYGPPNGGKTLLSMLLMASAQNLCWNCFQYLWDCKCEDRLPKDVLLVAPEIFDIGWATLFGVDPERLWVVEPDSGEIAAEIIADSLRSKDCGLVVLDSLPMLIPSKEIEGNIADSEPAIQARMIAKMMRKIKAILIKQRKPHIHNNVTFVATNQIRAKFGQGFNKGPSEEMAGGYVPMHDWHLTLRMSQPYSKDRDKETELPINGKFSASLIAMGNKKKLFVLAGKGEFLAVIGEGGELPKGTINDFRTVNKVADQEGLIDKKKKWALFGREYGTKGMMLQTWVENKHLFLSVKKQLVDHFIAASKARLEALSIRFDPLEEGEFKSEN